MDFQNCFSEWAGNFRKKLTGRTISFGGKTSRRSRDNQLGKKAIHMMTENCYTEEITDPEDKKLKKLYQI